MPNADEAEMEWPVRVYRKTEQSWQKMQPKNEKGQTVVIKATPRKNCIVLQRIQVRVKLVASAKDNDDKIMGSTTTVVRRRNCLLITSRQRLRALLLQFRSLKECLEFSDRLVALNPPPERAFLLGAEGVGGEGPAETTKVLPTSLELSRDHGTSNDSNEVLSYVGRLLHDKEFAAMVDNLENCILASEDGACMLEALVAGTENEAMGTSTTV